MRTLIIVYLIFLNGVLFQHLNKRKDKYAKSLGECWRLPSIDELKNAYKNKVEGFQSSNYWSSSTYAQNTNYVWLIDFYNGHINDFSKLDTYYVRCVREVA